MPINEGHVLTKYGTHREQWWHHTIDNGTTTGNVAHSADYLQYANDWQRTTVNTPEYRKKILNRKKDGLNLPVNGFIFVKDTNYGAYGTRDHKVEDTFTGTWDETLESGYWNGFVPSPTIDYSVFNSLYAQCVATLLSQVQDQSVNLGAAIGEGYQTVKLFASTARQLANAIHAVKRGDMLGAANALGVPYAGSLKRKQRKTITSEVSKRWLELQYGWKPLLSDLYGLLEFHANKLYKAPRHKVSVSKSRKVNTTQLVPGTDWETTNQYEDNYTCKLVAYFTIADESHHDLSSLGLINPMAIAWELVPLSFVVDWAIPIGSYLSSLTATWGLTFEKGSKTLFYDGKAKGTVRGRSYTDGRYVTTNTGEIVGKSDKIRCERTVMLDFPSPVLPEFKNPFSQFKSIYEPGDHALNALALMAQAFSHGSFKDPRGRF